MSYTSIMPTRTQSNTCMVFDISRAIESLSEPPLPDLNDRAHREFLIDAFVKHTIAGFQWVSVPAHRPHHYKQEVLAWFDQQQIATRELYHTVRFRPQDAGSTAFIHRIKSTIWVFIPNCG